MLTYYNLTTIPVVLALLLGSACSKEAPTPAANPTPAPTEAPAETESAPSVPDGPLAIRRAHNKGQTYTLRFQRSDERLSVQWLGTAEVLDTSAGKTSLGIHILSIESQFTGKEKARTATNIRVRIEIQDGSHDAKIISSDSKLVEAGDLTAFEEMAGDLCQPPTEPHDANSEWQADETRKHSFAGISATDSLKFVTYKHQHRSENMDMDCEASIAIDDGYAGQRDQTTTLKLGEDLPPATQKHSLTIRRL